uniref:Putative ovule protein n=1 Tax=Solanum chacoense TaxID=4108 RepID=A0A0V0H3S4_SOLCH
MAISTNNKKEPNIARKGKSKQGKIHMQQLQQPCRLQDILNCILIFAFRKYQSKTINLYPFQSSEIPFQEPKIQNINWNC